MTEAQLQGHQLDHGAAILGGGGKGGTGWEGAGPSSGISVVLFFSCCLVAFFSTYMYRGWTEECAKREESHVFLSPAIVDSMNGKIDR